MPKEHDDIWLRRPAPEIAPDLESFDGERYLSGIGGQIEAEHVHRYVFAAGLCDGKDVLDIACGEGYGSAMLAGVAESVVGVDIDEATIERARASYAASGVEFEPGDCVSIPYQKDSFDVVVSFETIEHIEDQTRFLREVRRVLRPGGLFICSTPDTAVYQHPDGKNPFHTKELTRDEFDQLVAKRFANIRLLGQRLISGSIIARGESARAELTSTGDGSAFRRSSADERATFMIAVCSDDRLPRIDSNILDDARYSIGRHDDLTRRQHDLQRQSQQIEAARLQARADADAAHKLSEQRRSALVDIQGRIKQLEETLGASNDEIARLSEQAGRIQAERDAAANERDAAIRDAAAVAVELGRVQAELEQTRREMIEAREKAAAAQAYAAASEAERETLRHAAKLAIEGKDQAFDDKRSAEIETARIGAHLDALRQDLKCSGEREQAIRAKFESAQSETQRTRTLLGAAQQESARLATSRSWRWTAPIRTSASAMRALCGLAAGAGVAVLETLKLPGAERLRVERRAALVRRSGFFNPDWYRSAYPGVAQAGVDPAWHFAARGSIERRNPSPKFDTAFYLSSNPDVAASGMHAFEHFMTQGINEGRAPLPQANRDPKPANSKSPVLAEQPTDIPTPRIDVPTRRKIEAPEVSRDQLARTKAIAFYLPQYHPIPENDAWWGKGFTEWTNVTRARAMFPGHPQPMLPSELGFYDLRLPEVRERQAELARSAGIHGFCYYHYWFNGRRVLERPLDDLVRSSTPDFPFCVCWANENWTRRWDGMEQEVLLRQEHSLASDRAFILDLLPYLEDDRYIRVDGKPVILVYRADLMKDPADTAAVWRDECHRAGLGEIHLCAVQFRTTDPRPLGFDAAVEFPPHHFPAPEVTKSIPGMSPTFSGTVLDYHVGVETLLRKPASPAYRLYRGVMPSWDNSARRLDAATIHHGSSPEAYEAWLRHAINHRQPNDTGDNLVFINAWNEWAEGTVLEPRRDIGDAYLRATARALNAPLTLESTHKSPEDISGSVMHTPSDDSLSLPAKGNSVEVKLKRVVRTNPALNAFVNRHPELKNKAAGLVRRISQPENGAARSATPKPSKSEIRWRGTHSVAAEKSPKLLVVSHDAALAGAQLIVLENIRHWVRGGVDCRVLLLGSGPLETEFAALCPAACKDDSPGGNTRHFVRSAIDQLAAAGWHPDASFCNTVASVDAAVEIKRSGIPIVSAVYELPTSIDDSLGGQPTIERIMDSSKRVVVASRFVRDRLASAYATEPDRLEPIHTGVLERELSDITEARTAIRAELGVAPETPIVLGCGSIHHRKGTDLFVAAAAEAQRLASQRDANKRHPTLYVWVGEDQAGATFGNWCRHDAERLGVASQIRFVGAVTDPSKWFAGSDVFALTSREDPFPMVNLEAINAGLPVIAFEGGGGAPEILTPHDIGVVVPYADVTQFGQAIDRIVHDTPDPQAARDRVRAVASETLGWHLYMHKLNDRLADCSNLFSVLLPDHTAANASR